MLPATWIDGRAMPPDAAHVSSRDRGLTLADGVFETMRLVQGRIFRLDRHLSRLRHALEVLAIPFPADLPGWLSSAIAAVREDTADAAASVRVTVTRGVAPGGLLPPATPRPTVILTIAAMPPVPDVVYSAGLHAHVASGRRNEHAMTAGLKTVGYTDAVLALLEAQGAGCQEALFLDVAGHCSEASASNLFACRGGTLLTPPVSCAALPGITRAAILEMAAGAGLPAEERPFTLDDLFAADEAFLTSSLRGVAPLTRVDGRAIGSGRPGPLTRQFSASYAALIALECGGTPALSAS